MKEQILAVQRMQEYIEAHLDERKSDSSLVHFNVRGLSCRQEGMA